MAACLKDSKSNRAAGRSLVVSVMIVKIRIFHFPFYSPSGLTQFSKQSHSLCFTCFQFVLFRVYTFQVGNAFFNFSHFT